MKDGVMDDANIWRKRVADWRASGETAADYCEERGLSLSRLRYWAYKRPRGKTPAIRESTEPAAAPAFARVVRAGGTKPQRDEAVAIVLEVDGARVHIGRGFDREALADVVAVLRAGGAR